MPATPINDAVRASITDAFKAVDPGHRGALLVLVDADGARAMVAAKFGTHWKVAAETAKPWTGPVSGSVAIVGSW